MGVYNIPVQDKERCKYKYIPIAVHVCTLYQSLHRGLQMRLCNKHSMHAYKEMSVSFI